MHCRSRIARGPGGRNPTRRRAWLLRAAAFLAASWLPVPSLADVVPPAAVEVAEGWMALVDRGDIDTAIARYAAPEAASALRRRLARRRRRVTPVRRAMNAWGGHGEGDTLRMAPGGYFSMVFDADDASGAKWTEEIRMTPDGHDGWRVVDALTEPADHSAR